MKTPLPYLENALDSGHRLLGFLPPSYDEFMDSDLIQSAVCMRLHELGENLATIRRKFPEFYEMQHAPEWQYLIAMRHIISHGYRQLDMDIIWEVSSTRLAEVLKGIQTTRDTLASSK